MTNKLDTLITDNIKILHKALGYDADLHIVGGAVRDCIIGKKPKDYDVATRFTPEQVMERLDLEGITCVPIGIRRGTVAAIINLEPIEITTFRNPQNEKLYVDNIVTDLAARDFTINAMAYSLNNPDKLIDPYRGMGDLQKGIVRSVGDPVLRFTEDPHRMLRFIRFSYAKGLRPDPRTEEAIKVLSHLLASTSQERIRMELVKILESEFIVDAFKKLQELGLLNIFLPELGATLGVEQNYHHCYDVFDHTLKVVEGCPRHYTIRLAALLHDVGKPSCKSIIEGETHFYQHEVVSAKMADEILHRLRFSYSDIHTVVTLISEHMRAIPETTKSTRKFIRQLGDNVDYWIELKNADILGGKTPKLQVDLAWKKFNELVEIVKKEPSIVKLKLAINGNDIKLLGVLEGPEVGKLLRQLEDYVLEDLSRNTKELLIEKAKLLLS